MKNIVLLAIIFVSLRVHASEDEKKYTEAQLQEKVLEIVKNKIDKIKKKSIAHLTKELLDKEKALDEREQALNSKEEQIKISEQTLTKKILQVEKDQKKLIGCVDEHQKGHLRRMKQMVNVISNMKPAKAAEVLSVQDSQISVKILELIQPEKASKIFNLMDKEISARLQKQYLNMQK